jgi:hypothetical protein
MAGLLQVDSRVPEPPSSAVIASISGRSQMAQQRPGGLKEQVVLTAERTALADHCVVERRHIQVFKVDINVGMRLAVARYLTRERPFKTNELTRDQAQTHSADRLPERKGWTVLGTVEHHAQAGRDSVKQLEVVRR